MRSPRCAVSAVYGDCRSGVSTLAAWTLGPPADRGGLAAAARQPSGLSAGARRHYHNKLTNRRVLHVQRQEPVPSSEPDRGGLTDSAGHTEDAARDEARACRRQDDAQGRAPFRCTKGERRRAKALRHNRRTSSAVRTTVDDITTARAMAAAHAENPSTPRGFTYAEPSTHRSRPPAPARGQQCS